MIEKDKVDGRKLATSPGVFPYRLTNACKARIIKMFLDAGSSSHSNHGYTLGVLLEYCNRYNIDYRLVRVSTGFFLERLEH